MPAPPEQPSPNGAMEIPEPFELKLVTCGGRWLDEKLDYSDNVIVTAVLA